MRVGGAKGRSEAATFCLGGFKTSRTYGDWMGGGPEERRTAPRRTRFLPALWVDLRWTLANGAFAGTVVLAALVLAFASFIFRMAPATFLGVALGFVPALALAGATSILVGKLGSGTTDVLLVEGVPPRRVLAITFVATLLLPIAVVALVLPYIGLDMTYLGPGSVSMLRQVAIYGGFLVLWIATWSLAMALFGGGNRNTLLAGGLLTLVALVLYPVASNFARDQGLAATVMLRLGEAMPVALVSLGRGAPWWPDPTPVPVLSGAFLLGILLTLALVLGHLARRPGLRWTPGRERGLVAAALLVLLFLPALAAVVPGGPVARTSPGTPGDWRDPAYSWNVAQPQDVHPGSTFRVTLQAFPRTNVSNGTVAVRIVEPNWGAVGPRSGVMRMTGSGASREYHLNLTVTVDAVRSVASVETDPSGNGPRITLYDQDLTILANETALQRIQTVHQSVGVQLDLPPAWAWPAVAAVEVLLPLALFAWSRRRSR